VNTARVHLPETLSPDAAAVGALYQQLLAGWNARDADAFAAPFADDGESIGFDGSQLSGRAEIAATLRGIFADHPTGAYVGSVRSVRLLDPYAAVLRAVAGIVPAGSADIAPALNSIQRLVAARSDGAWRVVLFQNTPAQFHGRPELVQQLTEELRRLLT
jgi:uncharacterized protein (TIGR02246 family)